MCESNNNQTQEKVTLESLYAYLRESSKEFEQRSKEFDLRMEKMREEDRISAEKRAEEFEKKFDKLFGGIGNSNGDVAEEYFINAFQKDPKLNGETFDKIRLNMRPVECDDEYDIFLLNGKSAAIIEVKYNVKKDDIGDLLKKAENFRKYLTAYNGHKLYLGIASLSFRKITEKKILEKGIAVIKQVGNKMVVYDENLKAF